MRFLTVKGISKTFGSHQALSTIFLSIPKGQIFALLGESGSGKSTLMRIMAGLLDADEGNVYLEEKEIIGPKEHLVPGYEEIKLVSQNFDLFPNHSVKENILYPLRNYKEGYQEYRLKTMLELCKLEEYANQKPATLSGGEQQRVALACVLASEPALILLDEPFSHIDAIFRSTLKKVLIEVSTKTSTTLCLVTHESIDALSIADKVAILRKGKIVQEGSPTEIYNQPNQLYTAQLMGEINRIEEKTAMDLSSITFEQLEGKEILVRPEHIKLKKNKETLLSAKVKSRRMMGPYFKMELIVEGETDYLYAFSTNSSFNEGDIIGIKCKKDKLILIDK